MCAWVCKRSCLFLLFWLRRLHSLNSTKESENYYYWKFFPISRLELNLIWPKWVIWNVYTVTKNVTKIIKNEKFSCKIKQNWVFNKETKKWPSSSDLERSYPCAQLSQSLWVFMEWRRIEMKKVDISFFSWRMCHLGWRKRASVKRWEQVNGVWLSVKKWYRPKGRELRHKRKWSWNV